MVSGRPQPLLPCSPLLSDYRGPVPVSFSLSVWGEVLLGHQVEDLKGLW